VPIKVSVIVSTFNRGSLLRRALETYLTQTLPADEWEYLLVDDGSSDDTLEVCREFKARGLPLRVLDAARDLGKPKEPGKWRDGCALRNAASLFAFGEVLVSSHPEIMAPPDALRVAYDAATAEPEKWHTAIPYWLPAPPEVYDEFDWKADLNVLREVPGFYDRNEGNPSYSNNVQERRGDGEWNSEVWWATSMANWRWMGGFREFENWGPVDVDFMERRQCLGVETSLLRSPDSPSLNKVLMVYHQHHDEGQRDMDKVMAALRCVERYGDRERCRQLGGLYGAYASGPRERSLPGVREVMADHRSRYLFAADLCGPHDNVLDLGSGTGYGADLVPCRRFVGLDADAESVAWAREHHAGPGEPHEVAFLQADLSSGALPDEARPESFDLVTCFEVLEHLPWAAQSACVAAAYEALRPGGRCAFSTPQVGATPGTPFDRHMLGMEQFHHLLESAGFRDLRWHHQLRYGTGPDGNPVLEGVPPGDAEIMILTGVK
jgi:SAM-dependent methyltransferase